MSDCLNAEIRDLLPDLLHDQLDAHTRARVVAHVDGCDDCRSELELLRSVSGSIDRAAPRVDVERIVAALPKPGAGAALRRRVWADWRIAAAVTFLVAGGTSLGLLRNVRDHGIGDSTRILVALPAPTETTARGNSGDHVTVTPPTQTRPESGAAPKGSLEIAPPPPTSGEAVATTEATGISSRIGDLNERQLKSLLNDIDHMQATPITEPEPVVLRVTRAASPNGL